MEMFCSTLGIFDWFGMFRDWWQTDGEKKTLVSGGLGFLAPRSSDYPAYFFSLHLTSPLLSPDRPSSTPLLNNIII